MAYGEFLNKLFDLWYKDFASGVSIDIRQFSNFAQMAAGFPPEECGMCGKYTSYFAVESDGSVYPCDFYTQDKIKLGVISDGFNNLFNCKKSVEFMESSLDKPEKCLKCKYYYLCRGGGRRWRDMNDDTMLSLNYLCEGYKLFFKHCEDRIKKLGQLIIHSVNK